MQRFFAILCILILSTRATAEDKPAPAALTPKEIADGWILLFDGKTTFGWQIDGEAKIDHGALVLGGTKETSARPSTEFGSYALRIERCSGGPVFPGNSSKVVGGDAAGALQAPFEVTAESGSSSTDFFPLRVKAGTVARIEGIKLRPLALRPIFNGRDLTGWKKFDAKPERAKSEFSVTPTGEIHLKNGPGDLQTEGRYADFVLQIECFTNGPHLNSGVFFRCIPGLYQQGYEAQIQNWFATQPAREYTIEEYDPKTNELKEKTKVKATALDFGTGAIYRRIPARGPSAKDGEWFTMTIVANGRHLATWVNGVQQADWTDNRPLNENARNGCRLEKGAISLQGHDKTTDLLFRNIRIAELPAAK